MFINANEVDEGATIDSEVCVVGAGAAGITMARSLAAAGVDVTLLESGGKTFEWRTQELCEGINAGAPYPIKESRLRFLGGATNHWGGQSARLTAMDFERLPWIHGSGWPIDKAQLDPYYDRALALIDIAPGFENFADLERDTATYPRMLGRDNHAFEPLVWIKSPPTRMGVKFSAEIDSNRRIRCYLYANAIELVTHGDGAAIAKVRAKTIRRRRNLTFTARTFVLCAGAIEIARLLLASRANRNKEIGNDHDLVGRYFSEHVGQLFNDRCLVALPPGKKNFQEEHLRQRAETENLPISRFHFGFTATPGLRRRHSLMGISISLREKHPPRLSDTEAAVAEILATREGTRQSVLSYKMLIQAEQEPNPDNRITLSDERDMLGMQKVRVTWKASHFDRRSMLAGMRFFAKEIARTGNGRIRIPRLEDFDDVDNVLMAGHQIGTTRMGTVPQQSVTDEHGRVHGSPNLYIASNALFPTTGWANPTLTLLALTLRNAETIAAKSKAVTRLGSRESGSS